MSLPSGYRRLEYIKSTGTQYVDTLFNPTQNTKLVLDMAFLGSTGTNVAGVRNNSRDTTNRFGIISFGSTSKLGAFFRESSIQAVTLDNNRHLCDLSKDGLVFDGTSYGGANTGSFACTYSLTLFAWHNGADGVTCNLCKVYSCQIYDNGTIIRNYIPCQTAGGEIGLWDDVNSLFYGNAGTGTFTAGPVIAIATDKSEITKLEYIQSSGTQYINTGFKPNQDTRVTMDFNLLEIVNQYADPIFGVRTSASSKGFYFWSSGYRTTTEQYQSGYNNRSTYPQVTRLGRHYVDKNKNITTIDGVSTSATYTAFTTDWNMLLFNSYNNGKLYQNSKLKLYSCQIYDNDVLVRDLIAAKLSDGTVGLYDKLSGLLYINSGTGTFEAGPSSLNLPVNIGGTWKDANEVFVNIGGIWKTVDAAFVNIDGTWKELG